MLSSVHFNDQLTFLSVKFLFVLIAVKWARNQDFAIERSLDSKLKLFVRKMSLLSGMLSKLMQLSISLATGQFLSFFWKKSHLEHISHVFRAIWKNSIAKIGSYLRELNSPAPSAPPTPLLTGEVQNTFKCLYCILGLIFQDDLEKDGWSHLCSPGCATAENNIRLTYWAKLWSVQAAVIASGW